MTYDNTNSGALFKNKDKQTEKHPDYNGSLNVGGVDYWIKAWLKTSKANEKYMSLAVQPKEQRSAPKSQPIATEAPPFDDESDIPF